MNEEFAIAFKVAIDESSISKVKERLEQLKKELATTIDINAQVKQTVEDTTNSITPTSSVISPQINPSLDTTGLKNYTAQIDELQMKVNDLKATLASVDMNDSPSDIMWYRTELEKAQNRLSDLINKQKNLTKEVTKTATESKKLSFSNIADAMKKATKSAKVFTMALIGCRSIYFGIRKSMSTYLSQNEDLQNKLNACYYAIGSLFAPALEWIVNLFAKIIGYVNVFLKALGFAGINMSKFGASTASTASSAKEIKKSLSGFDELNNIGSDSSSGGSGGGAGEVDNPFDSQDLDLGWVEKIKEFAEWCKENIPLIAGLLLGVAAAITAIKLGCDGIKALGIGLVVGGIVMAIGELLEYLQDPSWEHFGGIIEGIGIAIIGVGAIIGSVPVVVAGVITLVAGYIAKHWSEIKSFLENVSSGVSQLMDDVQGWLEGHFGIFGSLLNVFAAAGLGTVKGLIDGITQILDGLFKGVKQILDGIIKICQGDFMGGLDDICSGILTIISGVKNGVETIITTVIKSIWEALKNFFSNIAAKASETWTNITSGVGTFFSNIWSSISSFFTKVINGFVEFWKSMGNKAKEWVTGIINKYIISPINSLIGWINEKLHFRYSGLRILGKEVIPSFDVQIAKLNTLPKLNVGTGYVPNDMVAQLHKGEAVIPKRFNEREYFGSSNDETNSLLETLINRVDNLELNPYITVKDIGKASVKYINQQSRIMGNNVI